MKIMWIKNKERKRKIKLLFKKIKSEGIFYHSKKIIPYNDENVKKCEKLKEEGKRVKVMIVPMERIKNTKEWIKSNEDLLNYTDVLLLHIY